MKTKRQIYFLLLISFLTFPFLFGKEYTELYRDGTVFRRYSISKEGFLEGAYYEYYPNGKVHIKALYDKGFLNGKYLVCDKTGRILQTSIYLKGTLAYPMSRVEIERELKRLSFSYSGPVTLKNARLTPPYEAGRLSGKYLKAALRHVQAYRFLCALPYRDLELKESYIEAAQHGAALLSVIGRLDHSPSKPAGMKQEFFSKAYIGTSRGNLYSGGGGLVGSIDSFMNDSDSKNIRQLGHRRWILNPAMKFTGFGEVGHFAVLYAHDRSRKNIPDYDFIPFPPRGYLPPRYFSISHAWNVTLNPKKFTVPDPAKVKVKITQLNKMLRKTSIELELEQYYFSKSGYGVPLCLIFRPVYKNGLFGQRFWVEIDGLKRRDGNNPVIEYLVQVGEK